MLSDQLALKIEGYHVIRKLQVILQDSNNAIGIRHSTPYKIYPLPDYCNILANWKCTRDAAMQPCNETCPSCCPLPTNLAYNDIQISKFTIVSKYTNRRIGSDQIRTAKTCKQKPIQFYPSGGKLSRSPKVGGLKHAAPAWQKNLSSFKSLITTRLVFIKHNGRNCSN